MVILRFKNFIYLNLIVFHLDLVQPVCLPSLNAQHSLKTGDSVYVVGFGRTLTSKTSPIKQKLKISIYNHDECKKKFALKNVEIHDDQLCAGGGGFYKFFYINFNLTFYIHRILKRCM